MAAMLESWQECYERTGLIPISVLEAWTDALISPNSVYLGNVYGSSHETFRVSTQPCLGLSLLHIPLCPLGVGEGLS
jgi:hypothetical protein